MKILVTGANGFIGSHLVDQLLLQGHEIRCLVRPGASLKWLSSPRLELFTATFSDSAVLDEAVRDREYIFHSAGRLSAASWQAMVDANILPTRALLEAIERVSPALKRFVFVSSSGAAGPSPDGHPLKEDELPAPISAYGRSKLEAEGVVRAHGDRIPFTIVRPCAVYGPRDANFLLMFQHAHSGLVPLVGKEEQWVCMIHVKDMAKSTLEAAFADNTEGQTYFLASPRAYRRTEILDTVSSIAQRRGLRVVVPPFALKVASLVQVLPGFFNREATLLNTERIQSLLERFWTYDTSLAQRDFGFLPTTSLREGLQETYDWYLSQRWLKPRTGKER